MVNHRGRWNYGHPEVQGGHKKAINRVKKKKNERRLQGPVARGQPFAESSIRTTMIYQTLVKEKGRNHKLFPSRRDLSRRSDPIQALRFDPLC